MFVSESKNNFNFFLCKSFCCDFLVWHHEAPSLRAGGIRQNL